MAIPPPNYTQVPNILFDDALYQIETLAELKVTLVIIRQTFGWHKKEDNLSISRLAELTGLSRQSVIVGVTAALKLGLVTRRKRGQSYLYRLNVKLVNGLEENTNETSQDIGLATSQESRPVLVKNLDTQKKDKEIKDSAAHAALMRFLAEREGAIPDGAAQGKAVKWLINNYTVAECKQCFDFLASQTWRTSRVSWLTVKSQIGAWKSAGSHRPNGRTGNNAVVRGF